MNIGLIIALVAILLVLILGYNIMLQFKVKAESARKQESSRFLQVIDATEDLIGHAHHLPYSKELLMCLNMRILTMMNSAGTQIFHLTSSYILSTSKNSGMGIMHV